MNRKNIQDYIKSGVIEDYCLGVLGPEEMQFVTQQALIYDEIKKEIENYESCLKRYVGGSASGIETNHKQKTFEILDNLATEDEIDIRHLPLLNKYSDPGNWLRFLKPLLPAKLEGQSLVHELADNDGINQFVLWTAADCPYEIHNDFYETVLVLEGRCICYIEDEAHSLSPGDLITIPLYQRHNVEVVEGPVMALVQRIKAA